MEKKIKETRIFYRDDKNNLKKLTVWEIVPNIMGIIRIASKPIFYGVAR